METFYNGVLHERRLFMNLQELNTMTILIRLSLAVCVGGIIGFERGSKAQSAGLRTYILVCLGSTIIMMTNEFISIAYGSVDPARMGAQVVSGIGFIGAGTIMVTNNNRIKGLTTAAGIWAAAGIGLAIGIGFYEGAIASAIMMFLVLYFLQPLKQFIQRRSKYVEIHIVCDNLYHFNKVLDFCLVREVEVLRIQNILEKESIYVPQKEAYVEYIIMAKLNERFNHVAFIEELSCLSGVQFIEEVQ